jgi:hypothetical protein
LVALRRTLYSLLAFGWWEKAVFAQSGLDCSVLIMGARSRVASAAIVPWVVPDWDGCGR